MAESMKRKRNVTILLTLLVVVGLLVAAYVYLRGAIILPAGEVAATVEDIYQVIASYIRENHGNFPKNEDDLIHQNFLSKIKMKNGYEYFIRTASLDPNFNEKHLSRLYRFGSLTLRYGTQVKDIEMIDGKLYDRSAKEQILLIDGPYKKFLKRTYESISDHLYELMLQEKQQGDGS